MVSYGLTSTALNALQIRAKAFDMLGILVKKSVPKVNSEENKNLKSKERFLYERSET